MKFRAWRVAGWLALWCAVSVVPTRGADTAAPPTTPNPGLSATLTNLSRSGLKKDGLKQLEEELNKSLQPFSPKGSFDTLLTPRYIPPPVVVPERRQKSDLERRRNWQLTNPEDAAMGEDPFKAFERSGKKESLEDFYNSLNKPSSGSGANSAKSSKPDASGLSNKAVDELDEDTSAKLPSGIRETAKSLRDKLLGTEGVFNRGTTSRGSSLSDLFAPRDSGLSKAQIEAHKEYMTRYRQTFDMPQWGTEMQNPLTAQIGLNNPQPKTGYTPTTPLSSGSSTRDTFAATPAAANAVLHPMALPDLNDRTLNSWNPLYIAPTIEPPKTPVPVAPPMMEVPRRRF